MKKLIAALCFVTLLSSCYSNNEEDLYPAGACDLSAVTYSGTVSKIMAKSCTTAGCHAGATPANGMNLETYAGVKAIASSGELLGAVNHASGYSPMPQGQPKLDQCSLDQIADWVGKGAQNN